MRALVAALVGAAGSAGGGERGHRALADRREDHRRAVRRADRARAVRPARGGRATRRGPGAAYAGDFRATLRAADPAADRAVPAGCATPRRRPGRDDEVALAAARGTVRAGLFRGAYAVTVEAAEAATRRPQRWLLLREYRTATRFTRPGASATLALDQLGRGKLSARAARAAVAKDLLDAYQARLRELLADIRRGVEQDLPVRRAEAAAQAAGYFAILAPRYAQDRGAAAEEQASAIFAALPASIDQARSRRWRASRRRRSRPRRRRGARSSSCSSSRSSRSSTAAA